MRPTIVPVALCPAVCLLMDKLNLNNLSTSELAIGRRAKDGVLSFFWRTIATRFRPAPDPFESRSHPSVPSAEQETVTRIQGTPLPWLHNLTS